MDSSQMTRHIQVTDDLWLKIETPADTDKQGQALIDDLVDGVRALLGLPPRSAVQ